MPNLALNYQSGLAFQLFFNKPMASPTGIWLGLSSGIPTNLYNGGELNQGNYARQSIGTGVTTWSFTLNSGLVYNNNQITFPVATSPWGMASGFVVYDGFYGNANMMYYGTLPVPKDIGTNDQFYCGVSGLGIQVH